MTSYTARKIETIKANAKAQDVKLTLAQVKVLSRFDRRTEGSQCGDRRALRSYLKLQTMGLINQISGGPWIFTLTPAGKTILGY